MKVYHNILELVGNTPLVELSKLDKEEGAKATVYAKIEAFNPAGSAKDRIALNMIETAEKKERSNRALRSLNQQAEIQELDSRSYARKKAII